VVTMQFPPAHIYTKLGVSSYTEQAARYRD